MLSTMFIILFLLMFNLPYEMYMAGGDWISKLLGPAVVALAYPLYLHRRTLMKMAGPIMIGTASGSFTGVVTGFFLAKQAGFEDAILYAMTTKSVTIPVAMAVTETLGGDHIICCCICNDCRYWRRTDV
jgi:putative effector of murein hydrolase